MIYSKEDLLKELSTVIDIMAVTDVDNIKS